MKKLVKRILRKPVKKVKIEVVQMMEEKTGFNYILKRSERKSLALKINSRGEIYVMAPVKMPILMIESFIQKNEGWLINKLKKIQQKQDFKINLKEGGELFYLGDLFKIKWLSEENPKNFSITKVKKHNTQNYFDGQFFHLKPETNEIELKKFYKTLAKQILKERLDFWVEKTSIFYNEFRLKDNKTNWGSCSSKGNINLNWRLVMAPLEVLDYVIIHELCHIKEMNHSPKFWVWVEKFDPTWKEKKAWLKTNGYLLHSF